MFDRPVHGWILPRALHRFPFRARRHSHGTLVLIVRYGGIIVSNRFGGSPSFKKFEPDAR
jgi:hypothetical protein